MATPSGPVLKDSPIMLRTTLLLIALLLSAASSAQAQVTIPNTFTNGEVADAAEVNANFSALADALDVTVPNSFANSGIADANEINSNFEVLKAAVEQFTTDAAAATAATDTAFNNGVASVDITSDNQAVCEAANGSWDAGGATCSPDDALCMPTSAGGGLCSFCVVGGICDDSPESPPHCSQCCSQGSIDCS